VKTVRERTATRRSKIDEKETVLVNRETSELSRKRQNSWQYVKNSIGRSIRLKRQKRNPGKEKHGGTAVLNSPPKVKGT